MRRVLSATLMACSLALLSFASMPSTAVSGPMTVSGAVTYYPYVISSWTAGDNTFIEGAETADWYGSFDGTSFDTWIVCAHGAGFWSLPGGVHVSFTGYACGVWGTLEILLVGKGTIVDNVPHWTGHWVILSGTGDLANLEGSGDWWGVGTSLEYSGHAEFA
jgi:hypothetical protein